MIKSNMCFLSSSCWFPSRDNAESLTPMMFSMPSLETTTSNATMSKPPKSSATESNQNLYLSNTSVSSNIAEPTHDFQLPEMLLRLRIMFKTINVRKKIQNQIIYAFGEISTLRMASKKKKKKMPRYRKVYEEKCSSNQMTGRKY